MVNVSIIMPNYNSADFIENAISSVLSQSYINWELIVVDDCSSDHSAKVAQLHANKDHRIRFIQLERNSGAAVARNTAIEAAQGRYIAFLDSDDIWMPTKLEKQLAFMQEKDVAFTFTAYEKIDEKGKSLGVMGVPDKVEYSQLLKCCVIGCLTAMYDTQKIAKTYMSEYTKREDFATWLKLLKKVKFAYGLSESLAKYRVHGSQSSASKLKMAKENWLLYRKHEKLGLFLSCYYFVHYSARGILRQKNQHLQGVSVCLINSSLGLILSSLSSAWLIILIMRFSSWFPAMGMTLSLSTRSQGSCVPQRYLTRSMIWVKLQAAH